MSEGNGRSKWVDWRAIDWLAIAVSALVLVVALWAIDALHIVPEASHTASNHHTKQNGDGFAAFFQFVAAWSLRNRGYVEVWSTFFVALFTALLFFSTWALWSVTERTLGHAKADAARQMRDMEKSLRISKQSADAATAGNRAWLKITVEIDGPLSISSVRIMLPLKITVRNVGQSPATQVNVCITMLPERPDGEREEFDPCVAAVRRSERQAVQFASAKRVLTGPEPDGGIGDVVFPGEEIEAQTWYDILPFGDAQAVAKQADATAAFFYVAVCAGYRTSTVIGKTTVVFGLCRPGEETTCVFEVVPGDVPADQVGLRKLSYLTAAD